MPALTENKFNLLVSNMDCQHGATAWKSLATGYSVQSCAAACLHNTPYFVLAQQISSAAPGGNPGPYCKCASDCSTQAKWNAAMQHQIYASATRTDCETIIATLKQNNRWKKGPDNKMINLASIHWLHQNVSAWVGKTLNFENNKPFFLAYIAL